MPRKFKMAFGGSDRDLSQTAINDLGATARTRIVDNKVQPSNSPNPTVQEK